MIIIEGRVGKSKVLEDIINNRLQNNNVAIIDTVGVKNLLVPKDVDHFLYGQYTPESVVDIYKTGWFDDYEWVIFEININKNKSNIEKFKEIDRNSTQNFIVTVQTQDDDIRVYFV